MVAQIVEKEALPKPPRILSPLVIIRAEESESPKEEEQGEAAKKIEASLTVDGANYDP